MTEIDVLECEPILRKAMERARLKIWCRRLVKEENHPNNLGVTPELALTIAIVHIVRAGR